MPYLLPFLGGLAGSLHCMGMCGPFALVLGAGHRRTWRSLLYNTGRVGTLIGLGALSGALGAAVVASGPAMIAGRVLALATGGFMLVIALEALGVASIVGPRLATLAQATVGRGLAAVLQSGSPAAPLAFGAFNALLPCHLIYAFVAQAAATASSLQGTAVMAAFGLGTVPAMLGMGLGGGLLAPRLRRLLAPLAGVLMLSFAVLTIGRGLGLLPGHAAHGEHDGRHHQLEHADRDGRAE